MTVLVYNSTTGVIQYSYSFSLPAAQVSAFLEANTPAGCSTLEVPDTSQAIQDPSKWKVQSGSLVQVS